MFYLITNRNVTYFCSTYYIADINRSNQKTMPPLKTNKHMLVWYISISKNPRNKSLAFPSKHVIVSVNFISMMILIIVLSTQKWAVCCRSTHLPLSFQHFRLPPVSIPWFIFRNHLSLPDYVFISSKWRRRSRAYGKER